MMQNLSMYKTEQVEKNKPPTFVSVETTAFSGATLLTFLLGTHPKIATVAEMNGLLPRNDPSEYLCSCGQIINKCEFWQSITTAMNRRGFEFNLNDFNTKFTFNGPPFLQQLKQGSVRNQVIDSARDRLLFTFPSEARHIKAMVDRNVAFIESVLSVTGKQVFVDSSKSRLRLKALSRFSNLDVRAIHLIRDVRGVVVSDLRHEKGTNVKELANNWRKRHYRLKMMLESNYQGKYIRICYEDLCQNPQDVMARVYEFCGVDPQFKMDNFRKASHHLIGNSMRLSEVSEIKLDERWRRTLTSTQLQEIDRVAGALSRQFGYKW